jgi:hypothetical protein
MPLGVFVRSKILIRMKYSAVVMLAAETVTNNWLP